MELKIYQVDAFAEKVFEGNPAAVIPLGEWLPDELMQKIGHENNLSETAFFLKEGDGFHIRWFTPTVEVDLCGHATLASAHVLFNHLGFKGKEIEFNSRSGILRVTKDRDLIQLDFPASYLVRMETPPALTAALNIQPVECWQGVEDIFLVYEHENDIRNLKPNFKKLAEVPTRGVIVTAKGEEADFVSRFFAPAVGVNEDPVTGSAHTMLVPYWTVNLGKKVLHGRQISERGGNLYCEEKGPRVYIAGRAVTYRIGQIFI